MLKLLAAPTNNERSPRYMEKALAAIHQALHHQQAITLEYGDSQGRVGLYCRVPNRLEGIVAGPLAANYPRAAIQDVAEEEDPRKGHGDVRQAWHAEIRLEPELFPILRHAQFEDPLNRNYADPIDSLLRAIRSTSESRCLVEIVASPAPPRRCRVAQQAVRLLDRQLFHNRPELAALYARCVCRPVWRWPAWIMGCVARYTPEENHGALLDTSAGRHHEREADLQAAADKLGGHIFSAHIRVQVWARDVAAARERVQLIAGALGAMTRSRLATFSRSPLRRGNLGRPRGFGVLLSHEELATLWHPPTAGVGAERMQVSPFTELEPPTQCCTGREPGAVTVGRVRFRDDTRLIGLSAEDRRRHVHIMGRTGVGKTTLLLNQIHSDLIKGHGLALIDPHGDLADQVVRLVPRERTNDVVLFDVGDRDFAVSFNPLACPDPTRIDQVTSGVVSAFKKIYDSWGPRLENSLRNAVFATVEQGGTLLSLLRLLNDEAYRERFVPRIRDDVVRAFWTQEFAGWNRLYRTEAVAAITNKIQPFLTNTSVRAIVSQEGPSLDLRQVMDEGKVLIVNLSKRRVGEDQSALLGAFLVTAIQQAAMTRAEIPESDRRDFYLYIDEFQNFTTGSFAAILSEARKYRLNLTIANQYLAQLDEVIANAIAGNVGSIIAFAVGSDDAEWLATTMAKFPGQLTPQDLTNLPRYTAYARLLVDGMPAAPCSLATLPPPESVEDRYEIVVRSSQRHYARAVRQVHAEVERQLSIS